MAPPRERPDHVASRRKAAVAVRLWGGVTLASVVVLAFFAIWHLVRRGRMLRDRLGPPRQVHRLEPPGGDGA